MRRMAFVTVVIVGEAWLREEFKMKDRFRGWEGV